MRLHGRKIQIKRTDNWFSYGQRKSNEFTPFGSARVRQYRSWAERFHSDFITRHRVFVPQVYTCYCTSKVRLRPPPWQSDWSEMVSVSWRTDETVILLLAHIHWHCLGARIQRVLGRTLKFLERHYKGKTKYPIFTGAVNMTIFLFNSCTSIVVFRARNDRTDSKFLTFFHLPITR